MSSHPNTNQVFQTRNRKTGFFSSIRTTRLVPVLVITLASLLMAAPISAIEIQVEVLTDSLAQPPVHAANVCTLRKAINNANDNLATYPQCQAGDPGNDTIVFINPGTITFALAGLGEDGGETGDLDITDSITIIGHPDGTTIDAADLDRIFDINPGNAALGIVVTLRNIHITNGTGLGGAGAIQLRGARLILENCTISNSFASGGDGGAIAMADDAILDMTNTTITGNVGNHHAGAILVESGIANITNSTITGNNTSPTFTNLTGGIRNTGIVNLRNTVVAGNNPGGPLPNLDGQFNSLGYNIIGELGTTAGTPTIIPLPGTADQIDVNDALLNFGPLQSNGGPTPTRALQAGSIAIDKGHSSSSTTDQRGLTRPCDDGSIANAVGGDGGDVGAFEVQVVCAVGGAPNAVDDIAAVFEDSGANTIDVLSNDTDPDLDALTVSAVTQGANGSVVITNGGADVSYSPNLNFFGNDSFTYTVSDGNGGEDTATVNITVLGVQDAPNANDDLAAVSEDSALNVINVLGNDADVDGDTLIVVAITQGANGTVNNNGNSVSYTPNPDFFGSDSFTYTVSDGNGGTDTATVSVTVQNVNDTPVANNDSYSVNQDLTLNVPAPGVLTNDTDADEDSLTAVYVAGNGPNHGMLTLNADGSFSYTPDPGFTGMDTFDYVANDGTVDSNLATVTITVNDTQAPTVNCSVSTALLWPPNSTLINVGLAVNATDNDGMQPTLQIDVFSDEDDDDLAGGMSPDAKDIAVGTLRLRAERNGGSNGRVYIIRIRATDTAGNTSVGYCTVVVPKSQSKADLNAVNAEAAAAVAAFGANGNNPPAGFFVVGDGPEIGPHQ